MRATPFAAALLMLTMVAAGCAAPVEGPGKSEKETPRLVWDKDIIAMDTEEYLDTYDGSDPIQGTVLGVRGSGIVLDVGLEFALEVRLARVKALECGPTSISGRNFTEYDRALADALPGGTAVVGPLSQDRLWSQAGGIYLHVAGEDGTTPTGPSVNEALVRRGAAQPTDAPYLALPQFDAATAAQARQKLQSWKPPRKLPATPDGVYWPALKEAWIAAWRTSTGPVAGCVKEAARSRAQYAEFQAEAEEYQPGGKYYVPEWDLDQWDGIGDGNCDTCYWLGRLF